MLFSLYSKLFFLLSKCIEWKGTHCSFVVVASVLNAVCDMIKLIMMRRYLCTYNVWSRGINGRASERACTFHPFFYLLAKPREHLFFKGSLRLLRDLPVESVEIILILLFVFNIAANQVKLQRALTWGSKMWQFNENLSSHRYIAIVWNFI